MKDKIVVAENVTKKYRIGVGRARVREMVPPPFDRGLARTFPNWWYKGTFNALEDASFEINQSESVGLIGHNGAGKTTMLKVLAGVTAPTMGRVEANGRVAALIDALVGFHPELTGMENIYLLGSMYGFGRKAMRPQLDKIRAFAEIEDMLDTPVKRYSAGMNARLGFATITALEPEILLVDEILAVGDAGFQRKCIQWLDEFRKSGGTLLFVSHNLGLVRSMTQRSVWLDHGSVVKEGPTPQVLAEYARAMDRRDTDQRKAHTRMAAKRLMRSTGLQRWGSGNVRIEEVHIAEPDDAGDIKVSITYESAEVQRAMFCVGFIDERGREIGAAASGYLPLEGSTGALTTSIACGGFRTGVYFPVVAVSSPDGTVQDRWKLERAIVIEHEQDRLPDDLGPLEIPSSWSRERDLEKTSVSSEEVH